MVHWAKVNALRELQSPALRFGDASQTASGEELRPFFGRTLMPSIVERLKHMINLSFQTLIIVLLVTFIIGIIFGVSLARPKGSYEESTSHTNKSREISIKLTEEQLGKRKRLDDDKDVLDLTKWKPPSNKEIDWDKIRRDFEKKSKDKYD